VRLPSNVKATSVLGLRIAPDNIRAALLVQTRSGNELFLAEVNYLQGVSFGPAIPITSAGIENPTAVSWYAPDSLAVLDGSELRAVPLTQVSPTGGQVPLIENVPAGTNSITTSGGAVAVSTSSGAIYTLGPEGSWPPVWPTKGSPVGALGVAPAYPG
jgi:hypothetical protein